MAGENLIGLLVQYLKTSELPLTSLPLPFGYILWDSCLLLILTRKHTLNREPVPLFILLVVFMRSLRVRAVRVCHVYCNFKIGFKCRITVIFGTLKDGSLLINTLASNICFSYRNMFQNGVDALSKIVDAFLSKSSKFHLVRIIR